MRAAFAPAVLVELGLARLQEGLESGVVLGWAAVNDGVD